MIASFSFYADDTTKCDKASDQWQQLKADSSGKSPKKFLHGFEIF